MESEDLILFRTRKTKASNAFLRKQGYRSITLSWFFTKLNKLLKFRRLGSSSCATMKRQNMWCFPPSVGPISPILTAQEIATRDPHHCSPRQLIPWKGVWCSTHPAVCENRSIDLRDTFSNADPDPMCQDPLKDGNEKSISNTCTWFS